MSRYAKALAALVAALSTWAVTYFPDNAALQAVLGLAGVVVTAAAVFAVPNTPPAGQPSDPNISEIG